MKIEYKNGVRITSMYHELDPLDAAIRRYEEKAEAHFEAIRKKGKLTKEQQEAKENALAFLNKERRTLDAIASVQGQLAEYRERGLDATRGKDEDQVKAMGMMREEQHHPTAILEGYMRAEAVPKPSPEHTAHHIVPGKGKLKQVTARTRAHLHAFGIRINDPANGVYLLTKDASAPHWLMPHSRGHLKYHTHDYERWISGKVMLQLDIDRIKSQLQEIGRFLQENEPHDIVQD